MTKRITRQGCTVETTCTIQPNGTYTESVVLSVDPTSKLSLAIEERAALDIGAGRSHYPQSSRKVRR